MVVSNMSYFHPYPTTTVTGTYNLKRIYIPVSCRKSGGASDLPSLLPSVLSARAEVSNSKAFGVEMDMGTSNINGFNEFFSDENFEITFLISHLGVERKIQVTVYFDKNSY